MRGERVERAHLRLGTVLPGDARRDEPKLVRVDELPVPQVDLGDLHVVIVRL